MIWVVDSVVVVGGCTSKNKDFKLIFQGSGKVTLKYLQTVQEHLSPFGRGITRAWVGILSSLGVFSERGRFEVFFEVSWIHLS